MTMFKPGVFSYSGFGYGTYYSKDGSAVWCQSSAAKEQAHNEGLTFVWVDTLQQSLVYTHNWKDYLLTK